MAFSRQPRRTAALASGATANPARVPSSAPSHRPSALRFRFGAATISQFHLHAAPLSCPSGRHPPAPCVDHPGRIRPLCSEHARRRPRRRQAVLPGHPLRARRVLNSRSPIRPRPVAGRAEAGEKRCRPPTAGVIAPGYSSDESRPTRSPRRHMPQQPVGDRFPSGHRLPPAFTAAPKRRSESVSFTDLRPPRLTRRLSLFPSGCCFGLSRTDTTVISDSVLSRSELDRVPRWPAVEYRHWALLVDDVRQQGKPLRFWMAAPCCAVDILGKIPSRRAVTGLNQNSFQLP